DQRAAAEAVRQAFLGRPGIAMEDLDGLTVTSQDWWFNVRPSGTEPLLRLNGEASDEPTLAAVRDEVLRIVRGGSGAPATWERPRRKRTAWLWYSPAWPAS